jgi:hypothetical protein
VIRKVLLEAIELDSPKSPPTTWVNGVVNCLAAPDENVVRAAVATSQVLNQAKNKPQELAEPLLRLARDPARPEDLRIAALAALPSGSTPLDPELLSLLLNNLDSTRPVVTRGAAATVLAKSKLTDTQLIDVADHLKTSGPLETTKLLDAFEQCTNETVGAKLVESLRSSKSLTSLRPDTVQKLLAQFPPSVQESGKEVLASLQVDSAKQTAHLEELMNSLARATSGADKRSLTVRRLLVLPATRWATWVVMWGLTSPPSARLELNEICSNRSFIQAPVSYEVSNPTW